MTSAGDEDGGVIYGLESECRSLCALEADNEHIAFLVGTQGLRMTNQVIYFETGRLNIFVLAQCMYVPLCTPEYVS